MMSGAWGKLNFEAAAEIEIFENAWTWE